jgi:hypothetical protein
VVLNVLLIEASNILSDGVIQPADITENTFILRSTPNAEERTDWDTLKQSLQRGAPVASESQAVVPNSRATGVAESKQVAPCSEQSAAAQAAVAVEAFQRKAAEEKASAAVKALEKKAAEEKAEAAVRKAAEEKASAAAVKAFEKKVAEEKAEAAVRKAAEEKASAAVKALEKKAAEEKAEAVEAAAAAAAAIIEQKEAEEKAVKKKIAKKKTALACLKRMQTALQGKKADTEEELRDLYTDVVQNSMLSDGTEFRSAHPKMTVDTMVSTALQLDRSALEIWFRKASAEDCLKLVDEVTSFFSVYTSVQGRNEAQRQWNPLLPQPPLNED